MDDTIRANDVLEAKARFEAMGTLSGLFDAEMVKLERHLSTIVFADFPLSRASFTLGIISLLSSLIAIGFGVGLIYVLGDVHGSSIVMVDDRHPFLHLFALSIPEVWAFISFGTFFADISVIVWEAGVTAAAVALVAHLVAFGFLFREQDTTQFLIPDEPVFTTEEITEPKEATKSDEPPLSDSSLSYSKELLGGGLQSSPKELEYN
ncbi:uncharacterized protein FOMMEDRAFT_24671 [Fomitiporia mediterranea MF3/22]|uniref:uncharacterized protein n=1 Tax=Fomitiporia mediterranea (strain MF3/22) TaxID=694068 RepID=UPI0004408FBF|nr:uncharacterized protein FOMMEDRAFT_24671 [Fomitiporia mediterranea MF3/22]EJD07246.1 hypothetical protein FOMMEDRAFT_24671 [Fomitiporia mediterranea MF3/22]